jgi:hypothetical protein
MAEAAASWRLDWHSRSSDLPAALWSQVFAPPCEGRFWFEALEAGTQAGQFEFLYGCLRRGGEPVGIVPAFVFGVPLELVVPPTLARILRPLARGPLRGLASQRTFFIGNVAGEEGHVGLLPGIELADVAGFVHREARSKANALGAPMLVWKDVPDCDRAALDRLAAGSRAFRMASYPGTSIVVHPGGYSALLGTMRSERRAKIRAKLRKGRAAVEVRASVESRPSDEAIAEMFALFEQTRARATTRFETLTPGFLRAIAASEVARFVVLRAVDTGRMLAFMLVLDLGERAVNQYIGLDYSLSEPGRLYFRLFEAAYDLAATTGAKSLFSGQTGYMAKLDLGHDLVALWNYGEHRHWLVNAIYSRVAGAISWSSLDPQLAEWLRAHPEVNAP